MATYTFHLLWLRFRVYLPDEFYSVGTKKVTGFINVVLNYIGPNDGEGIRLFVNGEEEASRPTRNDRQYSVGDGRIVVGRVNTNRNMAYSSVELHELVYFNTALTLRDIQLLHISV